MALTTTVLLDAIIAAGDKMKGFENRMSNTGAFDAFLQYKEQLLAQSAISSNKTSARRPVKYPLLNKFANNVTDARTCAHTSQASTSAYGTLSWATKTFTLEVSEAQLADNYATAQDVLANQLMGNLNAVYSALDIAAVAKLEASKNAALVAMTQLATIDAAAYQITKANYDANKLYSIIPALMMNNDLEGSYYDIANLSELNSMLQYRTLGVNNSANIAGLTNGQIDGSGTYASYLSKNVTVAGTDLCTHYLAPLGHLGVYTWNDWEAVNGISKSEDDKKYLQVDPIKGLTWSVHEKTICVDDATYGSIYKKTYQFSCDFAFAVAYSSDTTSSIIKVKVPTSDL